MPVTLEVGPSATPLPFSQEELNQDPIGGAINTYLYYRHGANTLQGNYNLLETLPANTESHRDDQEPALTICIPVAITREDESTITRALDAIAAAQKKFAKPIDIILWANAKYDTDRSNEEAVSMEALHRYESLRTVLAERQDSGLHIRTALQTGPKDEMTMGQIRTNYMEAVAVDVEQQGLGYDHPVMWLDADLIDVSDKTFEQVVKSVQDFEGLFVHPMTHYGINWADGKPLSDTDAATRAVAIDEIMRRQKHYKQVALPEEPRPGLFSARTNYVEESGLAFAIGTYLCAGGLPVGTRTDETNILIASAQKRNDEARQYYAMQHDMEHTDVPPHINLLPEYIAARLTKAPRRVAYLPGSYTTMSASQQYENVKQRGPKALQNMWGSNYGGLRSYREPVNEDPDHPRIAQDIGSYINDEIERTDYGLRTDAQKARLGKLVTRYFGDADNPQPRS